MHWLAYFSAQQDAILQRYEARQTLWRQREQRRAEAPEIFSRVNPEERLDRSMRWFADMAFKIGTPLNDLLDFAKWVSLGRAENYRRGPDHPLLIDAKWEFITHAQVVFPKV